MRRASALAIVTFSTGALLLGVVSPAAADPALPDGQELYTVACDSSDEIAPVQLLKVNAADGTSSLVGTGSPDYPYGCAYASAWDDSTQTAYTLVTTLGFTSYLATTDLDTGVVTQIAANTLNDVPINLDSIASGADGKALAWAGGLFYSLDLDTGAVNEVNNFSPADSFYGFSYDPITPGWFMVVQPEGDLFAVDAEGSQLIAQGTIALPADTESFGLQIDDDGVLWVLAGNSGAGTTSLLRVDRDDLSNPVVTDLTLNGEDYRTISPLLVSRTAVEPTAAALPPTGFDPAPLVGGAVLLFAAGLVLSTRRRSASNPMVAR